MGGVTFRDAPSCTSTTAGSIIAEASLFTTSYHCDAVAHTDVSVQIILRSKFRQRFESDPMFAKAWANHLAEEVRAARLRAEILSYKTVTERLCAWKANNGPLPAKGNWKSLAHELGTSPEALYRHLAGAKIDVSGASNLPVQNRNDDPHLESPSSVHAFLFECAARQK